MKFKKRERIYIIPTTYGLIHGCGILLSLLIASTYSNNLIYLLSFFMLGVFLIAMMGANTNMKGIELETLYLGMGPEAGYAQGSIWLKNQSKEDRKLLKIKIKDFGSKFYVDMEGLDSNSLASKSFEFPLQKEIGIYSVKQVQVSSVYPLGLFYSWKVFKKEFEYVVYPIPEGRKALPTANENGESISLVSTNQGEDFSEHRKFEQGDSYHHVDWKALARQKGLLVKNFQDGDRLSIELVWESEETPSREDLRQFSKWIEECAENNLRFRVSKKGDIGTIVSHGFEHKERSLDYLVRELANAAKSE